MSEKYPLYPELSEEGKEEAIRLVDKFKKQLSEKAKEVIENILGDMYCDLLPHIESDAWCNFRNDLLAGFTNYNNRKLQGDYDFKKIRQQMLKEFRSEIIKDLNQDYIDENTELKKDIERMKTDYESLKKYYI